MDEAGEAPKVTSNEAGTEESTLTESVETCYQQLKGAIEQLQQKNPDIFDPLGLKKVEEIRRKNPNNLPWPLNQRGARIDYDTMQANNDNIRIEWEDGENIKTRLEIGHLSTPGQGVDAYYSVSKLTREKSYMQYLEQSSSTVRDGKIGQANRQPDGTMKYGNQPTSISVEEWNKSNQKQTLDKVIASIQNFSYVAPAA